MVKYTRSVGKKFHEDGSAREFPGNTIICHVPQDSPSYQFLLEFRKILEQLPFAHKYSFLPPSSYHMTVFEGVCDQFRKASHWTSKLPLEAPLIDVDNFLIQEWNNIPVFPRFQMKAKFVFIAGNIGIRMIPVSDTEEKKIREFRDLLSEKLGIKPPNHARYQFHITYAYQIQKMNWMERIKAMKAMKRLSPVVVNGFGIMQTDSPELCFFADMTDFASDRKIAQRNRKD